MFRKGQMVRVMVPEDSTGADMVNVFNGDRYEVAEVDVIKGQAMYALKGCVSEAGMPYWFCEEWLSRSKQ